MNFTAKHDKVCFLFLRVRIIFERGRSPRTGTGKDPGHFWSERGVSSARGRIGDAGKHDNFEPEIVAENIEYNSVFIISTSTTIYYALNLNFKIVIYDYLRRYYTDTSPDFFENFRFSKKFVPGGFLGRRSRIWAPFWCIRHLYQYIPRKWQLFENYLFFKILLVFLY